MARYFASRDNLVLRVKESGHIQFNALLHALAVSYKLVIIHSLKIHILTYMQSKQVDKVFSYFLNS